MNMDDVLNDLNKVEQSREELQKTERELIRVLNEKIESNNELIARLEEYEKHNKKMLIEI